MDIYQKIWNADQAGNGIRPVLKAAKSDALNGYVVVNELKEAESDHKLFTKVLIPQHKLETYDLCKKLFNNYTLDKTKRETSTLEENQEVHDLLEAIVDTKPMLVARQWMEEQTNEAYSADRWYAILKQIWFTQFDLSSGKDLTGFEHVVVGEQKGGSVSGYHFWYKYWLDDTYNLLDSDDIIYQGTRGGNQEGNILVPEVSTLAYKWYAFDYEAGARRPLFKKIGGFFNGCSIEGLLAIGTIRFLPQGRAPKEATINGAKYNLRLYRSNNNLHLITYYPEFVKQVSPPTTPVQPQAVKEGLKIIAALVNPKGHDAGLEAVTIINISPDAVSVNGWKIEDKNGKTFTISDKTLDPGHAATIVLPPNTAQLSNQGGLILLKNEAGEEVHKVSYNKDQAQRQGWALIF